MVSKKSGIPDSVASFLPSAEKARHVYSNRALPVNKYNTLTIFLLNASSRE